jgi:hypothetical protein
MKEKKIKNPWSFSAPQYDQRSSGYICAGTDYGVGHKTPVGSRSEKKNQHCKFRCSE